MKNLPLSKNKFQFKTMFFPYHFFALLTLSGCLLIMVKSNPVFAEETRQYTDITEEEFNTCIRTHKTNQGYAKYLDENSGKVEFWATIPFDPWIAGTLNYNFDPDNNTLEYRLIEANFPASAASIWNGLNTMIKKCGGTVS